MAVVDFTLDDVRRVVIEDVRKVIDESIDARFRVFEVKYDDDMRAIQEDLTVIFKRLDVVERSHTASRRIVDKHSKDIMQLRAVVER